MRMDRCGFQDDPYGRSKKFFGRRARDTEAEGGAVGAYAAKLLNDIEEMQAQSEANTTGGRGRSYGRVGDIYWRTDGYLRPFR
jgi:hypothetical protein